MLSCCRQTVAQWQKAFKTVPGLKAIDSLQPEKSAVSEELNLAWARHEIISDSVDEVTGCLAYCMTNLGLILLSFGGSCAAQHASCYKNPFCLPGFVLACAGCAWYYISEA